MRRSSYSFDFTKTFEHPLASKEHLVEMVPSRFLFEISSRSKSGKTDVEPGDSRLIKLPFLWRHMKRYGMRDPLIIAVGRDGTCRLETGNHRIQLFLRAQIDAVPAVVLLGDNCVISTGNGCHRFCHPLNVEKNGCDFGIYSERCYKKPSDVFPYYRIEEIRAVVPAAHNSL